VCGAHVIDCTDEEIGADTHMKCFTRVIDCLFGYVCDRLVHLNVSVF